MAGYSGRTLLVQVEQTPGSGTFIDVGGLRTKELKWSNEAVETTNDDDDGARTLLEGGGTRGLDVTGSGVFVSDTAYNVIKAARKDNTHLNFKLTEPGANGDEHSGLFMISEFSVTGEHNGAVAYSMTLMSDGVVTTS